VTEDEKTNNWLESRNHLISTQWNVYWLQYQMVKECTRNNSCINLVLTSDVFVVLHLNVVTPFSTSDHCMVEFKLLLDQTSSQAVSTATEYYYHYDDAPLTRNCLNLSAI